MYLALVGQESNVTLCGDGTDNNGGSLMNCPIKYNK